AESGRGRELILKKETDGQELDGAFALTWSRRRERVDLSGFGTNCHSDPHPPSQPSVDRNFKAQAAVGLVPGGRGGVGASTHEGPGPEGPLVVGRILLGGSK